MFDIGGGEFILIVMVLVVAGVLVRVMGGTSRHRDSRNDRHV
jgi:hypothetical protein